jgi:hypothetical protein
VPHFLLYRPQCVESGPSAMGRKQTLARWGWPSEAQRAQRSSSSGLTRWISKFLRGKFAIHLAFAKKLPVSSEIWDGDRLVAAVPPLEQASA